MSNITDQITRLQTAKANLKTSIEAKGVTVSADATLDQYPALVDSIPSGGGGVEEKDVNFYDYDGTLVYSYTKQEFLALTEMPANPDHTDIGLTAQGWNWSLADAKTAVQKLEFLDIGQMYLSSDTKIYVELPNGINTFVLYFKVRTSPVVINWGDGTADTCTTTSMTIYSHTYQSPGDYCITIVGGSFEVSGGLDSCLFGRSNSNNTGDKRMYSAFVTGIVLGGNLYTRSSSYVGLLLTNLRFIIISSSIDYLPRNLIYRSTCHSIVVPSSVTYIYNENLDGFSIISLPNLSNLTDTYAFSAGGSECKYIPHLALYGNVVIGSSGLQGCCMKRFAMYSTASASNVLSDSAFRYAKVNSVTVLSNTVKNISSNALANIYCSYMRLKNISGFGTNAFNQCYVMLDLVLDYPGVISASNIGGHPFYGARIYVPADYVESYKTASGWSTYASQIQAIPE